MISYATPKFWLTYNNLPDKIRKIANKQYALWKEDPSHPSIQFKKVGPFWSARVTQDYRALALKKGEDFYWFWVGTHKEYDKLIKRK